LRGGGVAPSAADPSLSLTGTLRRYNADALASALNGTSSEERVEENDVLGDHPGWRKFALPALSLATYLLAAAGGIVHGKKFRSATRYGAAAAVAPIQSSSSSLLEVPRAVDTHNFSELLGLSGVLVATSMLAMAPLSLWLGFRAEGNEAPWYEIACLYAIALLAVKYGVDR
jgi:hypothetical protein